MESAEIYAAELLEEAPRLPRCTDFDEDCDEVVRKVHCWLYDPERGFCPWLVPTDPPKAPSHD